MSSSAAVNNNLKEVQFFSGEQAPAVQEAPLKPSLELNRAAVDPEAWQVITCLPRLESENHADLMTEIHNVLAEGSRRIALDLTQNRFFSLGAIQLCVTLARDLASDGGSLALIACSERTKRHFEIYGSLKQIILVRASSQLISAESQSVVTRPRVSSQEAR